MLVILILSATGLVGCSNSGGVASKDGNIVIGKNTITSSEYTGLTAKSVMDGIGTIEYYLCNTMVDCEHNMASVLIDDMTDFKGSSKYYTLYHGTHIYLYVPYKGVYIESHAIYDDVGLISVEQAVEQMYNESKNLILQDGIKEVNFNDIVKINVEERDFVVRKEEVVIPGLLRVKTDDGSVTATEHITIGEKSAAKMSTVKYDYYQCDGVIIQAAVGTDITSLITFNKRQEK